MTTESTTYEVLSRGTVHSEHKTESAAVREAKEAGWEATVRMVVVSGTYQSRTTVWPSRGETISG